jgi:hypothetical protein
MKSPVNEMEAIHAAKVLPARALPALIVLR